MDSNYIPNFKTAFQHFLVHTGGRAVIEEVEKKLSLAPGDVQPSKETLFRYGNTCCAAVFYVLTNMEARVRARRPDPTLPYPTPFCAAVVCVLSSTEARVRGARAPPHSAGRCPAASEQRGRQAACAGMLRSSGAGSRVEAGKPVYSEHVDGAAPRPASRGRRGAVDVLSVDGLACLHATACLLLQGMSAQAALLCCIILFCRPVAVQGR